MAITSLGKIRFRKTRVETSAKSALNVEEAFLTLASELLRRAPPEKPQKKRFSLAASAKEKGRKCCS